jgi:hypothetical protein
MEEETIPIVEQIESNLITLVDGLPEDSALYKVAIDTRKKFGIVEDELFRIRDNIEKIEESFKRLGEVL